MHNLICHFNDLFNVIDFLEPLDGNSGQAELGPEARTDDDGAAAAVATSHHVAANAGLKRCRVQQAEQSALVTLKVFQMNIFNYSERR